MSTLTFLLDFSLQCQNTEPTGIVINENRHMSKAKIDYFITNINIYNEEIIDLHLGDHFGISCTDPIISICYNMLKRSYTILISYIKVWLTTPKERQQLFSKSITLKTGKHKKMFITEVVIYCQVINNKLLHTLLLTILLHQLSML